MGDSLTRQRAAPGRFGDLIQRGGGILPGLLLCVVLAGLSYTIAAWPALNNIVPLSALTVGILLGVAVRLCVPLPAALEPGVRWTLYWLLRTGIVLLGFRLVAQDMLSVGAGGLALVLLGVATTIALSIGVGRLLGLPDTLSTLVGCGTGICGASAVVAVDGVIRGREQDVACAIAMVTVYGTIAMFAYPVLAHLADLSEPVYAAWAGGSIHEVAQAVAAGFAFDDRAGVDASLYKLSRVALLAPVCAVLALWWRRRSGVRAGNASGARGAPFPMFVLLFVAVVAFNSCVDLPKAFHTGLVHLDAALLSAAMVAMGLQTRLIAVVRLGWRPLFLGAVVAIWLSALAMGGALLIAR
ncbi:YeiH family protein [Salinisphaera sp.]|uniref:YeiH family protein n=1 Tax=Salinisphaera sp. TaxID=1914330 RepID=UPI002D77B7AD|nr:YeiH family protein [Salinisphaera sp.]HET7313427.1 YeiH family protein [Salinisphaera sp.]